MFILRLDDASEYWNKDKWLKMHDLLTQYGIKPIIAIIPHNEDSKLLEYPKDNDFINIIKKWIDEGWTPALHGYNHVLEDSTGGLNPVNKRSEFADLPFEVQKEKISNGYRILENYGIKTKVFVAPAHTFDKNTLRALQENTDIRIISDTVANDQYYENGFYFIPQQSGVVRDIKAQLVTFCYHPNTTTEEMFDTLQKFIEKNKEKFISLDELKLIKREKSSVDKLLSKLYFLRRKL